MAWPGDGPGIGAGAGEVATYKLCQVEAVKLLEPYLMRKEI